jgi:hypothetical protein
MALIGRENGTRGLAIADALQSVEVPLQDHLRGDLIDDAAGASRLLPAIA